MKIVFFGYDYTLDIVQRLMADGHEITHIFTFPCDGVFAFNLQIFEFAENFSIPISEQKIEPHNVSDLINQGCNLFVCAGYPHKIPAIHHEKVYGINLHPTLLPRGRGIMPLPYIILREPTAAGFTIHKLAPNFDAGDIIYQKATPIDEYTDVETLSAQIAIHAPDAISDIVQSIETYWSSALPQDNRKATNYNAPDNTMRSLNWNDTVDKIVLTGRAFGRFGVIATIVNNVGQQQKLAVFHFSAWEEQHSHEAGTLLRSSSREIIICVRNGYVCLKEFQVIE